VWFAIWLPFVYIVISGYNRAESVGSMAVSLITPGLTANINASTEGAPVSFYQPTL